MEFTENLPIWYTEGSSSGRLTDDKAKYGSDVYFDLIRAEAMSPGNSIRLVSKIRGFAV